MRHRLTLVSVPLATALTLSASTLAAEDASAARSAARPGAAVISVVGLNNAVHVSWKAAPRATRYRVKWAYAPWDKWPSTTRYSAWLPASARSQTRRVSTDAAHDGTMTAVPYGSPVFVRVQTANGSRLGPWSAQRAVWPGGVRPASGRTVRLGTYNVMLAGKSGWAKRMPRIARNIASHGLGVVALQETMSTNGSGVASRLTGLTGHTWKVAPTGRSEGRILYDSRRFSLTGSGILNDHSPSNQRIVSYRTGRVIPLPWARLRPAGSSKTFVVVSIHFAPSASASPPSAKSNKQTGASARAVLAALNKVSRSSEPAVLAGDFAGGYGRWGDPNPAQPTLVRSGWWDSMASLRKSGVRFSTVNRRTRQVASAAIAGRADGIFLRGIHGSTRYQNVANFFMPGTRVPPSDHNLVLADFRVPGA
jgi:endonuclease/exonuclease/phosphatase family metal-dependent hydrolase